MPHQRKLTYKQEGYAQDRASGLTQSAAYRNNYDTSNMSPKTVHEATQAKRPAERKALGLCRDCSNHSIPGQIRCSSCAEQNRLSRRKRNSQGRAASKEKNVRE